MTTLFIAVDIGCIECGEDTNILGAFTERKDAENIVNIHEKLQEKHWHGQHYFEIYEIETDKEYPQSYGRSYETESSPSPDATDAAGRE